MPKNLQTIIDLNPETSGKVTDTWKHELSNAISSPAELISILGLEHDLSTSILSSASFKLKVPRHYVNKMHYGDPLDPLLRQVLPILNENALSGLTDPVGDLQSMPTPGLHHKYHGRALMITTGACAIHCRYCFRRHYPYEQSSTKPKHLEQALEYLAEHKEIKEVILSGGDPLVLDDSKISNIIKALENIKHIEWLRIHTRLPIVLPSRITNTLLENFSQSRFRITLVVHANHANELSDDEFIAFKNLQQHGVTLLNQSVLLKGVNDSASELIKLSEKLHDFGVLPYYLHCFDPVKGAMHFDVDTNRAVDIIQHMRNHLPGFLVPKLVKEEQGKASKTVIFSI